MPLSLPLLILMVAMVLVESLLEWGRVLSGRKLPVVKEASFVATRFATEER